MYLSSMHSMMESFPSLSWVLQRSVGRIRYYRYQPSTNGKPPSLSTPMSFASPHSLTGSRTPVGPVNMIDYGTSGTLGHQFPDRQSQLRYDSMGFGPNVGQRSQTVPRFFRDRVSRISRLYPPAFKCRTQQEHRYIKRDCERIRETSRRKCLLYAP